MLRLLGNSVYMGAHTMAESKQSCVQQVKSWFFTVAELSGNAKHMAGYVGFTSRTLLDTM